MKSKKRNSVVEILTLLSILDQLLQEGNTFSDLLCKLNLRLEELKHHPIQRQQLYNYIQDFEAAGAEINKTKNGRKVTYRYKVSTFSILRKYNTYIETQKREDIRRLLTGIRIPNFFPELLPNSDDKNEKHLDRIILDDNTDLVGEEYRTVLYEHILKKEVIEVSYKSFVRKRERIRLHPRVLKQWNKRWYVIGYDGNDFFKKLALDRIKSIKVNKKIEFVSPVEPDDWNDYFLDVIGVTNPTGPNKIKVVLWVYGNTKHYIETKPLHNSQKPMKKVTGVENCYETRIIVIPNYELEATLLWFGESVEVVSPPEFRKKMKKRLESALKRYKD